MAAANNGLSIASEARRSGSLSRCAYRAVVAGCALAEKVCQNGCDSRRGTVLLRVVPTRIFHGVPRCREAGGLWSPWHREVATDLVTANS
jgi:hypothetical protein